MNIVDRLLGLHHALDEAAVPHAFGGALALAWCTEQARGTIDIDVNVFVDVEQVRTVLDALPSGITWTEAEVLTLERDGQVRLHWDETPVDLFFNTTDFHERAALRAQRQPILDEELPFLACRDLAVFKAFFNRTKDWADLEAMADADALDVDAVTAVLIAYLGVDDERVARLQSLG